MTRCVVLRHDGVRECVEWPQCQVAARLGGAVTFVGVVGDAVALVGLADASEQPVNACLPPAVLFEPPARGDVIAVAMDEVGEEVDVDVDALVRVLDNA